MSTVEITTPDIFFSYRVQYKKLENSKYFHWAIYSLIEVFSKYLHYFESFSTEHSKKKLF